VNVTPLKAESELVSDRFADQRSASGITPALCSIHLTDHHDIDSAGSDVCKQLLQGGAFQGGTREGPVVVAAGKEAPAFMGLALDVRFAGEPGEAVMPRPGT
jgi:hypothetical protein